MHHVQEEARAAAQQLLDICHLTIAQVSARLASASTSSYGVPFSNTSTSGGGLPHSSAAPEPGQLLLTALTALQRLVTAESPLFGADDLENLIMLVNSTLQQASHAPDQVEPSETFCVSRIVNVCLHSSMSMQDSCLLIPS